MDDKERLEAYDNMYREIQRLYLEVSAKIDTLKSQGKTKTVTFRKTMGQKWFYSHVLMIYKAHGIKSDETL